MTFSRGDDGWVTPDFSRSKFEGGSQKDMTVLVNDLLNDKPGFKTAHELKQSIRTNVDFDKGGTGQVKGNWDLSTKRATAIVQILRENANINPENLTAAGRGEFAPIATNDNAEGKAKNRRIEVILTPKLDEISKLLNEI